MAISDSDAEDCGEEFSPLQIPEKYRALDARETKMTVRELWGRYTTHEIEPDFQRHYVWDGTRASRYVESLLLGLPTPPIFISEEPGGELIIIDGHQRLETLFRYMQPLLAGPADRLGETPGRYRALPPLRLNSLEVMSELNGTDVTALSIPERAELWDRVLSVIVLPRTAHPDMKYEMFARLNQGSMSLNPQELRNCLYRGPLQRPHREARRRIAVL